MNSKLYSATLTQKILTKQKQSRTQKQKNVPDERPSGAIFSNSSLQIRIHALKSFQTKMTKPWACATKAIVGQGLLSPATPSPWLPEGTGAPTAWVTKQKSRWKSSTFLIYWKRFGDTFSSSSTRALCLDVLTEIQFLGGAYFRTRLISENVHFVT